MVSLTYKVITKDDVKEKMQMKKIFEIVRAWLRPKEPIFTAEEQEMQELLERVRAWEAHYYAHETPEQRRERIFFEKMRGFVQF